MTTQRHRLLTRARVATAGLVLAAGSATGLLTVAAAHATTGTTTTTDPGGTTGSSGSSSGSSGSSQSSKQPVASSHSS